LPTRSEVRLITMPLTHCRSSGRVSNSGGHHDTFLMPSPIPLLSLFSFLDLLASAPIREDQSQPITGTFQVVGTRDNDINTYEGGPMFSGDRCATAIENVRAEIRTTNSMPVCHTERATVESSWPHRPASPSAPVTSSTPLPSVPGDTPIEGTHGESTRYGHVQTALSHSHHGCGRRTVRVAQRRGQFDCQASKGAVHHLDCAHRCGWHNFIPWRCRMRPWYNNRTSRSDHCWRDRGRSRQAAEARTEFCRRLGRSTGTGKWPSNHRGRG